MKIFFFKYHKKVKNNEMIRLWRKNIGKDIYRGNYGLGMNKVNTSLFYIRT